MKKNLLPIVRWSANESDDFIFKKGKYCLRVEKMDKKNWWWCVHYGKGYIGFDKPEAKTEMEAKLLAELCFVRHWQKRVSQKQTKWVYIPPL